MKKKADINIGKRADLAVHQMFPDYDDQTIAKIIGCHRHIFSSGDKAKHHPVSTSRGCAPSGRTLTGY